MKSTIVYDTSQTENEYRERRLESYKPPDRVLVPEWGERSIVLSEKETDFPGSYRVSVAPYCRGPMDAFTDRRCNIIVFCTCTQAGKTLNVIIVPLSYTIDQDPGSTLLVFPTEPNARSFSESRLRPVFDDSPVISKHKPTDTDRYKLLEMHFSRSDIFLVGSNSPGNLAQRPIRYLFADEIDKFPPASIREADALALAMKRTKAKYKSKTVLTSTPTLIDGNIWKFFLRSDQRHLLIECPYCHHKQKPIMGTHEEYEYFDKILLPRKNDNPEDRYRLRWPKDCRISELDDRAWYVCEKCDGKIYDAQMHNAINNATWKSTTDTDGVFGFHLNSFGLPWVRLGTMAASFLRTKRYPDELKDFYNSELALPWDEVARGATVVDLGKITESDENKDKPEGYLVNTCPDDVVFLTGGIDVQGHEVYYVIRGWGENGLSALISFGKVPVEVDDVEAFIVAVESIVSRPYQKPLILCGIDSGWGLRTPEVYVVARSVPRLVCTKCRRSNITNASDGKDEPIPRPKRIDKMPDGSALKNGPLLYSPSTSYWKKWVFARMNATPKRWLWPDGITISKDGKTYLRHIESEKEVTKTNIKTGRIEKSFQVRRGFSANHLLDCEVMAAVAQEIALTAAKHKKLTVANVKEATRKIKELADKKGRHEVKKKASRRRMKHYEL